MKIKAKILYNLLEKIDTRIDISRDTNYIILFHSEIFELEPTPKYSGGATVMIQICELINKYYGKNICFIINNENIKLYSYYYRKKLKYLNKEDIKYINPNDIFLKNNILITHHMIGNFLNLNNHITLNLYFSRQSYKNIIYYSKTFYNLEKKLVKYNPYLHDINHQNILMYDFYIPSNIDDILAKCYDKGYTRSNSVYLIKKGKVNKHNIKLRNKLEFIHPQNSIKLKYKNLDDLIEIFNNTKYFYTYDPLTFLVPIASLCGCIPIIVPFGDIETKEEIYQEKYMIYGSAYGDSEEQIKYAIETRHKVREELERYDDKYFKNKINEFLKVLKEKFNL